MNCPYCKEDNNRVIDSRKSNAPFQKRVRRCYSCYETFITIEKYVPTEEWKWQKESGAPERMRYENQKL